MLKLNNVHTHYDGLEALRSVSLEIRKGEIVCILGPNGAGKSTMLQTIAGLIVPSEGRISFNGTDIQGMAPHLMAEAGISIVPEEGWLFPQMNVLENLLMGAFTKGARRNVKNQMAFVYDLFPILNDRRHQIVATLSGGERQMLAVGRGLMSSPSIMLMDEPSLGLAPMIVQDILKTLVKINRENGTTILLTEQNIFHALKISGRGYLLENGTVVMEDSSSKLLASEHIKKNYLGI